MFRRFLVWSLKKQVAKADRKGKTGNVVELARVMVQQEPKR